MACVVDNWEELNVSGVLRDPRIKIIYFEMIPEREVGV